MKLTDTERMLLDMLQRDDARAQVESQARWRRFLGLVADRTKIPLAELDIDIVSGMITGRQAETPVSGEVAH